MSDWRANPVLIERLLDLTAQSNHVLRRRIAVLDVLARVSPATWEVIVAEAERELGEGTFGDNPRSRLSGDIRALRDAGIPVEFSRRKDQEGYYLAWEAQPQFIQDTLWRMFRAADGAHTAHLPDVPPPRSEEDEFDLCRLRARFQADMV